MGVNCNNPLTPIVLLVPKRLYNESDNKKKIVDKIVCAKINKLVALIIEFDPITKPNKIKFISWTVPYATNFFKSTCAHIFIDESIIPTTTNISTHDWLCTKFEWVNNQIPYNAVLTKKPLRYTEKYVGASTCVFVNQ